ncbi:MAG: beta-lactamase family protein [Selenomonadaceae bacterium]|nr:beta-lactamase family protein [Selenomonadaceae bacterium]
MTLDEELENMIGDNGSKVPGLGVIVFKDGEEVYSKFLGRRHINQDKPLTRDTRFRVASISKMFTIFTIMQLVDQGKINLDADISDYLGFKLRNPNFTDISITVRMLASHTSSLRDGKIYSLPPEFRIKEFFNVNGKFFDNRIHFAHRNEEIGKYFSYCNLNYGILGTIIERATNERFDLYQKKHILKQLNTKADYLVANLNENEFENLGTLYQKNINGVWNENFDWTAQIDNYEIQPANDTVLIQNPYARDTDKIYSFENYEIGTNATIFSPAGGLRISFEELTHCLEMLMNDGNYKGTQIIRNDLLTEMKTPQWIYNEKISNGDPYGVMFNYGLGIYKIDGNSKARLCRDHKIDLIGHSGEAYGMISGLYFIPGTKDGLIFMINGEAIDIDSDKRSQGNFSNNYIWEEIIINSICENIFVK